MKELPRLFSLVIAIGLFVISGPLLAQTPDGETPAEETVCDELKGLTPGLYGLCVAYCEAHDADLISPGGDPAVLNTPNRRILKNYNKKKTDADPPMPCVSNPCPCWTADELAVSFPPIPSFADLNFQNACAPNVDDGDDFTLIENYKAWPNEGFQFGVFNGDEPKCFQFNADTDKSLLQEITTEERAACGAQLVAHTTNYKADGEVWDCFGAH